MYKSIIILEQQTPLIHFQHNQSGATLRATEVKPLLDRFLLTNLGGGQYKAGLEKAQKNNWRIGVQNANGSKDDACALNYKIRITTLEGNDIRMFDKEKEDRKQNFKKNKKGECLYEPKFPLILSNMGGKIADEIVDFSFSERVELKVQSYHRELIDFINENIDTFFALNNFGNRCNKGFGSFLVKQINGNDVTFDESKYFQENTQILEFDIVKQLTLDYYKTIFDVIDYYWKRLKPGINYSNGEYSKSFLYTYLNKFLNRTWEKRTVKEFLCLGGHERIKTKTNVNQVIFGRALLGMPDKFEYGGKQVVKVTHPDFDRIASPIYFKPIVYKKYVSIYVLIKKEHIVEVLNSSSNFKLKKEKEEMGLELTLKLDGFDYDELLSEFQSSFKCENDGEYYFNPINFKGKPILKKNKVNISQL